MTLTFPVGPAHARVTATAHYHETQHRRVLRAKQLARGTPWWTDAPLLDQAVRQYFLARQRDHLSHFLERVNA